jgi:hypothetical protein
MNAATCLTGRAGWGFSILEGFTQHLGDKSPWQGPPVSPRAVSIQGDVKGVRILFQFMVRPEGLAVFLL